MDTIDATAVMFVGPIMRPGGRSSPAAPDIERLSPGRAVDAGCQSVPTRTKVAIDERVSGEETLGLIR